MTRGIIIFVILMFLKSAIDLLICQKKFSDVRKIYIKNNNMLFRRISLRYHIDSEVCY